MRLFTIYCGRTAVTGNSTRYLTLTPVLHTPLQVVCKPLSNVLLIGGIPGGLRPAFAGQGAKEGPDPYLLGVLRAVKVRSELNMVKIPNGDNRSLFPTFAREGLLSHSEEKREAVRCCGCQGKVEAGGMKGRWGTAPPVSASYSCVPQHGTFWLRRGNAIIRTLISMPQDGLAHHSS